MNSITKIKELRSKGYRVEARGPSVILFRPNNQKRPDAGEAFEICTFAKVCAPWDHERDASEMADNYVEMLGDLTE